jgi:hypothetical protein
MRSSETVFEKEMSDGLCGLRSDAASEDILAVGTNGSDEQFCEPQILRSEVHGERDAERSLQQSELQSSESTASRGVELRNLRIDTKSARASQGRGPSEQRPVELEDLVRFLPQAHALGLLRSDHRTAEALSILRETVLSEYAVRDASHSIQEIWASIGKEAQDRLRLGFDASRWRLVVPFPLVGDGEIGRVGKLRAYGNAIVSEVAEAFIGAYLEHEAEAPVADLV